jgi:hypothetical protein
VSALSAREYVGAIVATACEGEPWARVAEAWQKVRGKSWAYEPPPENDSHWSFSRKIAAYDAGAHWSKVSAPALLVYGELDERVPARASAARIAQAYLEGNPETLINWASKVVRQIPLDQTRMW